jgi:hypothetical protein
MSHFHHPFRGWLSQRLNGREWLLLGLFLLFYLGLMIGPGEALLEAHRVATNPQVQEEPAISQAETATQDAESFLGLP